MSAIEVINPSAFDPRVIRKDFPIFDRPDNDRLVYLDSAASSQRPRAVLDAMDTYYSTTHANVHRGVYAIAEEATRLYELARKTVGQFLGAPHPESEVVFTKNVTEAINLVAHTWGRANLKHGDVVVLSEAEHHTNLVPWLMLAQEREIELRFLPVGDDYHLDLSQLDEFVDGARLVAITAVSNVLGTVVDIPSIVQAARANGALVLVDGAQLAPHRRVSVAELDVDFFGMTGHKMLGPTGIGVLWARKELLESMPPFLGGGEMIRDVRLDGFTTNDIPWKFEAGTPPIAEAIGLMAAIEYLEGVGFDELEHHEVLLTSYLIEQIRANFPEVRLFGPEPDPKRRSGVVSFSFGDVHPHDVAQVLDGRGVCVRAGHHCAKPLMRRLGVSATTRASLYLYNDTNDVDILIDALGNVRSMFQ